MKLQEKEELEKRLKEIAKELGRFPTKYDIPNYIELPSYNTLMRRGISFTVLAAEFKKELYEENPKFCIYCSSKIIFDKRRNDFCSNVCSATHFNIIRGEDKFKHEEKSYRKYIKDVINKQDRVVVDLKVYSRCLCCSFLFKIKRGSDALYCGKECYLKSKLLARIESWLTGLTCPSTKSIYTMLKYIDGNMCSVCGIEDWNNKSIRFEVEHIDGDSTNNSPENVCLICPNCHSQTDTYKGKNVGNGRYNRRQRYAEGKSY